MYSDCSGLFCFSHILTRILLSMFIYLKFCMTNPLFFDERMMDVYNNNSETDIVRG